MFTITPTAKIKKAVLLLYNVLNTMAEGKWRVGQNYGNLNMNKFKNDMTKEVMLEIQYHVDLEYCVSKVCLVGY